MSCKRAQEFLAQTGHVIQEETDARRLKLGGKEACALAEQASRIYVCKGKRIIRFNMKNDPPDSETLLKSLLGPTGNLRAPTLRRGKTLVVGFHADLYQELFG